jgi:hypothetical protein
MFGISPFAAAPFASLGTVNVDVSVTGVGGNGLLGIVVAGIVAVFDVTGVGAAGSVGTLESVTGTANVELVGVQGTTELGTVQPTSAVRVTGVSGTGEISSVIVDADAIVIEDSVVGTGQIGTVDFRITGQVFPQGVQGEGQIGQADAVAASVVVEDGDVAYGLLGTPTVTGDANVDSYFYTPSIRADLGSVNVVSGYRVDGVQATGSIGSVMVQIPKSVTVTGVSAIGRVQTPLVWGNINDSQDPNWVVIPT